MLLAVLHVILCAEKSTKSPVCFSLVRGCNQLWRANATQTIFHYISHSICEPLYVKGQIIKPETFNFCNFHSSQNTGRSVSCQVDYYVTFVDTKTQYWLLNPYTKTQLSIWCQQKLVMNLEGHPVHFCMDLNIWREHFNVMITGLAAYIPPVDTHSVPTRSRAAWQHL